MTCLLRAFGDEFDIDSFARETLFEDYSLFKKGEPRNAVSKIMNHTSGIVVSVSKAQQSEFELQLEHAEAFIQNYKVEIQRLLKFPMVQYAYLDFGLQVDEGLAARFWNFPCRFLKALADLGLGLEVSCYEFGRFTSKTD